MTPTLATPKSRTRQVVLEAIVDLQAAQQLPTRENIARATGLKMTLVDDHCDNLVRDEIIIRVKRGVYYPIEVFPEPRAISVTPMDSGRVKLEIGDAVFDLTPREARLLGTPLMGYALQLSMIQFGHEMAVRNAQSDVEARRQGAKVAA